MQPRDCCSSNLILSGVRDGGALLGDHLCEFVLGVRKQQLAREPVAANQRDEGERTLHEFSLIGFPQLARASLGKRSKRRSVSSFEPGGDLRILAPSC